LNALDYFIIIILAVPFVTGFFKGFIRMVFSLLGLFGGFVLSIVFARPFGVFIGERLGFEDVFVGKVMAFLLIVITCAILGILGGWFARKLMESANLGFADRCLGGALGFLQGTVIVTVILILVYLIPATHQWADDSLLASGFTRMVVTAGQRLPSEWREYLMPERWLGESRYKILKVLNEPVDQSDDMDKSRFPSNDKATPSQRD